MTGRRAARIPAPAHPRTPVRLVRPLSVNQRDELSLPAPGIPSASRVHELRQEQLPTSKVAKAFRHVQFHARSPIRVPSEALPALVRLSRPAGAPDRKALVVRAITRKTGGAVRSSSTACGARSAVTLPSGRAQGWSWGSISVGPKGPKPVVSSMLETTAGCGAAW